MVAPTAPAAPDYPANLSYQQPERIARWRPLVQWLLALPHYFVLYALRIVTQVLAVVSWFVILFTGRLPAGIANFQTMYLRYQARVSTYAGFLQETYPPFAFDGSAADPGTHPHVRVDVDSALDGRSRLSTFFRLLLAIPQLIVLYVLGIAAFFVWLIAFFAVLITAHWPAGLVDFAVGYLRWSLRVEAYVLLLTDRYPPFSLGGGTTGVAGSPTMPTAPQAPQPPQWSPQGRPNPA